MIPERYRPILLGFALGILVGGAGGYLLHSKLAHSGAALEGMLHKKPTSGLIYFSGEFKSEGVIRISPGDHITLTQALVMKGGLTDFADRTKVKIIHSGTPIGTEPEFANLVEIIDQNHFEKDPVLNSGDMVIVSKRIANF